MCLGALNRFQFATLVVQSYPVVPDALGVAAGLVADAADAAEQGEPNMAGVVPIIGITSTSIVPPLVFSSADQDPAGPLTAVAAMQTAAAASVAPAVSAVSPSQQSALQLLLSMPCSVRGAANIAQWLQLQYAAA